MLATQGAYRWIGLSVQKCRDVGLFSCVQCNGAAGVAEAQVMEKVGKRNDKSWCMSLTHASPCHDGTDYMYEQRAGKDVEIIARRFRDRILEPSMKVVDVKGKSSFGIPGYCIRL